MADADEADFLELVIANDRISNWLDILHSSTSSDRKKQAVMSLRNEVTAKASYAEEAKAAGAVTLLLKVLSKTGDIKLRKDEEVMEAAAQIVAACSGPMAQGGKIQDYKYGGITVTIKEGTLGDGVGAKVWTVAHIICKELLANASLVSGRHVLEIGSGTGVAGIMAAKLQACEVVLTDYDLGVLRNLRQCVSMNSTAHVGHSQEHSLAASLAHTQIHGGEDAPFLEELHGDGDVAPAVHMQAWDFDNMSIRTLDWHECLFAASSEGPGPDAKPDAAKAMDGGPEPVPPTRQFDVIIGTDVMYEMPHASMVPAVIARHLQPHGKCLLCCAVRQTAVFARFQAECCLNGLRYRTRRVQPEKDYEGIIGREDDYEGGFVMIAIDHAHAQASDWHRSDFDESSSAAPQVL